MPEPEVTSSSNGLFGAAPRGDLFAFEFGDDF
jgi:hypothetical protein